MMNKYFEYRKNKTNFATEVRAGVATFLTMVYILALNPGILSAGGFDKGSVFLATIIATLIACLIMGLWARTWPVALSSGMGLNSFVAFVVCGALGYSPAEALGAVFVAGLLFLIVSFKILSPTKPFRYLNPKPALYLLTIFLLKLDSESAEVFRG